MVRRRRKINAKGFYPCTVHVLWCRIDFGQALICTRREYQIKGKNLQHAYTYNNEVFEGPINRAMDYCSIITTSFPADHKA